jgi:hypothetical protein
MFFRAHYDPALAEPEDVPDGRTESRTNWRQKADTAPARRLCPTFGTRHRPSTALIMQSPLIMQSVSIMQSPPIMQTVSITASATR